MKKLHFTTLMILTFITMVMGVKCVEASVVTSAISPSLTSGLVGWWKLDEGTSTGLIIDSSGNGNHGTTTGSPAVTSSVSSKIKYTNPYALTFNGGSTQYVNIAASASLRSTTGTWSYWAKYTPVTYGAILTMNDGGASGQNGIHIVGNILQLKDAGGIPLQLNFGNPPDANWHHYVLTFDRTNRAYFYIDGVLKVSGVPSGSWSFGNNPLRIGLATCPFWATSMNGSIDDIRIYNRVLTATAVNALYNSDSGRYQPTNIKASVLGDSLVGYWKFDEGTSTGSLLDSSGNGYSAKAYGSPVSTTSVPSQIKFADPYALSFNGVTNKWVDLATTSNYFNLPQGTLSFWVNVPVLSNGATMFSKNETSSFYDGYIQYNTSNGIMYYAPGRINTVKWGVPSNNAWHHVVLVVTGSQHLAYLDNVLVGTSDTSLPMFSGNYGLQIGRYSKGDYLFNGSIDDVRIYSKPLLRGEVAALYNSAALQFKPTTVSKTKTDFLNSGLIGYWTFDGSSVNYSNLSALSFRDFSGNNYFGTTTTHTNANLLAPGKTGSALSLNGSTQFVSLGTSAFNFTGYQPFSVSAWINTTQSAVGQAIVGRYNSTNQTFEMHVGPSGALFAYIVTTSYNTGRITQRSSTIPYNTWVHVAMVYSGGSTSSAIKFYINGVDSTTNLNLDNGGTYTGMTSQSIDTRIGSIQTGSNPLYPFAGKIDNVRIYNRAILQDEIKQLYLSGM